MGHVIVWLVSFLDFVCVYEVSFSLLIIVLNVLIFCTIIYIAGWGFGECMLSVGFRLILWFSMWFVLDQSSCWCLSINSHDFPLSIYIDWEPSCLSIFVSTGIYYISPGGVFLSMFFNLSFWYYYFQRFSLNIIYSGLFVSPHSFQTQYRCRTILFLIIAVYKNIWCFGTFYQQLKVLY